MEETKTKTEVVRCGVCPSCEGVAIQTMCMRGCEIVCIPCQKGGGMFNDWDEIFLSREEHEELYNKYENDIQKLAFESGGAGCVDCNKTGGNNCETCKISEEFKFYTGDN